MEKFKRNERLAVISQVLTLSPNQIVSLSTFCEMFAAAKSTISEDIAILTDTFRNFHLGSIETVTGASGGVRFRPIPQEGRGKRFVERICDRLRSPGRVLPGGFLYFTDILCDPKLVSGMGKIFASEYYDTPIDFILTMETKGIPVALMTAEALHVPLIVARRSSKVYEGSAVNINYVSGSGSIETMSVSRRAIREGSTALIVDDFIRGGGTAHGMLSLLNEFNVKCAGLCFVMAVDHPKKWIEGEKALILMKEIHDDEPVSVRVADWVK